MIKHRKRIHGVWLVSLALMMFLASCSLFRGSGPRERVVQLVIDPSAQLNWDGQNSKPLQVAVFVLTDTDRFLSERVATLFYPDEHEDDYRDFADDVVENGEFTVRPEQPDTQFIRYTITRKDIKRVYLGIIGDFFEPAGNGQERKIYALKNSSKQEFTLEFGKNEIESIKRTR